MGDAAAAAAAHDVVGAAAAAAAQDVGAAAASSSTAAAGAAPEPDNPMSDAGRRAWDRAINAAHDALECYNAADRAVSVATSDKQKADSIRRSVTEHALQAKTAALEGRSDDAQRAVAAAEKQLQDMVEFVDRLLTSFDDPTQPGMFTKQESSGVDLLMRCDLLADTTPRVMKRLLNRYLLAKYCCLEVRCCVCRCV